MKRVSAARRASAVRMVGPAQWIVWPMLLAMAATLLLATPIELFGLTLPEPVIPLVLAFAWPLIRPSVVAPIALLATGLFLDLLWGGPAGLWPLSLLAVYGLVLLSRALIVGQDTRVLFGWYAACVALAFCVAYLVVWMRVQTAPSLISLALQVLPTVLLFPLADRLVQRFDDGDVRFR